MGEGSRKQSPVLSFEQVTTESETKFSWNVGNTPPKTKYIKEKEKESEEEKGKWGIVKIAVKQINKGEKVLYFSGQVKVFVHKTRAQNHE